MISIGIAQWCLDRPGAEALHRAAALGLSVIHIDAGGDAGAPPVSHPAVRRAYVKAMRSTGIRITGIGVNSLNSYELQRAKSSAAHVKRWDDTRRAIDAALEMNVEMVFLPSFEKAEMRTADDILRTGSLLHAACVYAEGSEIVLATENTLGVAGNLKLLAAAGHAKLRVLIDSLNPVLWGHDPRALITALWPHVCNQVHAKDGVDNQMGNAALNTGQADFAATMRVLQSLGFGGCVIIENEYDHDLEPRLLRDAAVIRRLLVEEPSSSPENRRGN
jgi:sugar phosphate isomerase/epimerase